MVKIVSYHQSRDRANPSAKIKPHCRAERTQFLRKSIIPSLNTRIALHPFCFLCKIDRYCLNQTTVMLKYRIQSLLTLYELFLDRIFLRNGKTYSHNLHPKMALNAENTADAPATRDSERVDETVNGVSPDLTEEKSRQT